MFSFRQSKYHPQLTRCKVFKSLRSSLQNMVLFVLGLRQIPKNGWSQSMAPIIRKTWQKYLQEIIIFEFKNILHVILSTPRVGEQWLQQKQEVSGKLVKHLFKGLLPSYLLFLGFVSMHSILWFELTEETNLPKSLPPLLNVKGKQDNFWKIPHNQAEIHDYNGIKLQSLGFQLH